MATIKAIDGRSVHQIQSGQVIVDLQSVCKELIENSIDAGATSIEVRFKNSGLDAIEVQDNGTGIAPADYDTIALKHYTSKLSTYDDLASLQTFGFRGEALSSLCALSHFHIVTARPSDGPKGTKLEFEQSGKLRGTSVVAAKQGTTVVVETLFHNLPVRRKELEKNIKREYNKVLHLLNAYACISVGVKFIVSNQPAKGKKTIAFSTNANASTRENISNVYGARTITALIPLELNFEMEPSHRPGATQNIQDDSESRAVKIVGHISRPVVGEGRQTPDRQMFFVNARPCNLPQVAKAFNEAYKSYNITQSPFIFADLRLNTNAYDVNVSPDKRSIMLHDQTALLESLKESLLQLFEGHDQSVPSAQLLGNKAGASAFKAPSLQPRASTSSFTRIRNDREDIVEHPQRKESSFLDNAHDSPQPGFIKASLIEEFAGRDAEDRDNVQAPRRKRIASPVRAGEILDESPISHNNRHQRQRSMRSSGSKSPPYQKSPSPLFEPHADGAPLAVRSGQVSKVVEDFNARMLSPQPHTASRRHIDDDKDAEDANESEEEPVPALDQTPRKPLTQSTIQNAFDRMRPLRTPTQQATITIGDTATVSTIGSGSQTRLSKKARIHTPRFASSGGLLGQTSKKQLFSKSLRNFAAPGTQAEISDEDGDEETLDSTMLEHSQQSPPSEKHFLSRPFDTPRTDDLVESSSAPLLLPEANDDDRDIDMELHEEEESGDEYVDESEKKAREEAKIERMIAEAEEAAARPTESNVKRANKIFKVSQTKYQTVDLETTMETSTAKIVQHAQSLTKLLDASMAELDNAELPTTTQLNKEDPEERLSLTVSKADFNSMQIIGQFNLGFIIALRPPNPTSPTPDLFIIDQHASDEKYNFERLSASTTLVSQRLVHPHPLELTAVEEELIRANTHALSANGFTIDLDAGSTSDDSLAPSGPRRSLLTALPMSREATFTPKDLEELLALLLETPPSLPPNSSPPSSPSSPIRTQRTLAKKQTYIPRPTKVRALLASRACRSSVMIGKTLSQQQMGRIVRHMGGMDKPWSCPHGRPTMRHLFALDRWEAWREWSGAGEDEEVVDWSSFVNR